MVRRFSIHSQELNGGEAYDYGKCNRTAMYPFMFGAIKPDSASVITMSFYIEDQCRYTEGDNRLDCIFHEYLYWRRHNTRYERSSVPKNPDKYAIRGKGDCKERAAMLTSLFINLGYDAHSAVSYSFNRSIGHVYTVVFYNNTTYEFEALSDKNERLLYIYNDKVKYACYDGNEIINVWSVFLGV